MSKATAAYTDSEIWDACAEVMAKRPGHLEVKDVSAATGMPEGEIIAALIRETGVTHKPVQFRYPPLPCAAITQLQPRTTPPPQAGQGI